MPTVTEDQYNSRKKTFDQTTKSVGLQRVKELTSAGQHQKASKLFNKLFPGI